MSYNHLATCPMRLPDDPAEHRYSEEIRCFTRVLGGIQARAFAHGNSSITQRHIGEDLDLAASRETARKRALAHNLETPFLKLPGGE